MWVKTSGHSIIDIKKAESVGLVADFGGSKNRYSVKATFPKGNCQKYSPVLIQTFDTLSEADKFLDNLLEKLNAEKQ